MCVPVFLLPYLFGLAFIFSFFRDSIRNEVENPYVVISIVILWLVAALIMNIKKEKYETVNIP